MSKYDEVRDELRQRRRRWLITGAAGFIGSNLLEALLRLGQAVDAGWTDVHQLDTDQDLAPLWVSDRFREIRRRVVTPSPLL